jgi:hypothetical protein
MITQSEQITKSLYETDYHLWVLETVKKLQNKAFDSLDLENLIEEVSDLSRREKRKLETLLTRLFEHLLKLKYWESARGQNQGHWEAEVLNFRKQIKKELRASPSLKPYLLEIFDECYQDGREIAATRSQLPLDIFPEMAIADMDRVLDENWLP